MRGKIYKIVTGETNDCYVGSTIQELRFRFRDHKGAYKQWLREKSHYRKCFDIFEKYGKDECKIILIKEYEVVDKRHLEAYEQLWINKLKPINKNSAFTISKIKAKHYREENKESIKERAKKYREENKEKIKEKHSKYYENNKERLQEYYKEYKNENNDRLKQYKAQYYENNKQRISEKSKQRVNCDICGKEISKASLSRHKKNIHKV